MESISENGFQKNQFGLSGIIEIKLFRDPWMDNGLENLYRILEDMEFCEVDLRGNSLMISITEQEKFVKELTRAILNKRENLIVNEEDRKTRVMKEVKKDYVIIQEEKKVGGKVALKEDLYKSEKTYEIVSEIFSQNQDDGENLCILCGRRYNKSVKKLQQASYPFVTKIASLSGVRSYKNDRTLSLKEYYNNLCPICYLVGILEWTDDALIYRTFPGERSFLFMPYFQNLRELNQFKESCVYSGILNNNKRYSNIRVNPNASDVEHTPGEFSTLLCFYEKFIDIAGDETPARDWAVLSIPFGPVKNVKIDFLSINEGILGVIKSLKEGEKVERIYSDLMKKVYFFSQNKKSADWEITREIQEMLSKYFMKNDFSNFTNTLLPRKGGYVFFSSEVRRNLEELIFEWRLKNMGVEKERLAAIKSVGNILARISENNISLLYKMDKTRTIEEFWSVFREIARKLPGLKEEKLIKEGKPQIKPTALDEVIQLTKEITETNKDGWREVRDLIVVYASMYYSLDRLDRLNKLNKGGDQK